MKLSAMCIRCLMDRQEERVRECGDEEKKAVYLKEAAGIIASSWEGDSAHYLVFWNSLCRPGRPDSNSQRSTCLCLPSVSKACDTTAWLDLGFHL